MWTPSRTTQQFEMVLFTNGIILLKIGTDYGCYLESCVWLCVIDTSTYKLHQSCLFWLIMLNKRWIRDNFFLLFADFNFPHVSGSSSIIFLFLFLEALNIFSCLLKFCCIFPAMPSCNQEIEEVGPAPSVHTPCPPVCLPVCLLHTLFLCYVAPLCSFSLNKPFAGVVPHLLSNSGVTWMSLPP